MTWQVVAALLLIGLAGGYWIHRQVIGLRARGRAERLRKLHERYQRRRA